MTVSLLEQAIYLLKWNQVVNPVVSTVVIIHGYGLWVTKTSCMPSVSEIYSDFINQVGIQ